MIYLNFIVSQKFQKSKLGTIYNKYRANPKLNHFGDYPLIHYIFRSLSKIRPVTQEEIKQSLQCAKDKEFSNLTFKSYLIQHFIEQ